jgi:pentatricopeptide repeat protein
MNEKTLELFQQLQPEEMIADGFTFVQLFDACVSLRALEEGRHIHMQIIEWGCESDACVGSSLVDMYSKCGSIVDARRVFNRMPECNVVAWSAMILGHVKSKARRNWNYLIKWSSKGRPVTFVGVLIACARVAALGDSRHVHEEIV